MSVDRITKSTASSLLPGQTVWDQTVKGFGIRRQRNAAVYILKYRQAGKQRFKTIGRHGSPWTAETAREVAKRYLLALIQERLPAAGRDISVPSFTEFAERYLAYHAAGRKKPSSLAEDRRNLDRHILPALGTLRLDKITRRDVAEFHAAQHSRPINGNRCLSLISHIFSIAEKWDLAPPGSNPCRGIDRYPERRRERMLDADEVGRLGAVLNRAGLDRMGQDLLAGQDWRAVACLRLLILTGARLGDVLGLQWGWINWERGYARLPDSKTGAKTIPLPPPALQVLEAVRRKHHQAGESKFVLPGGRPDRHFKAIQKPWQRIRAAAGLKDVRIHDLRHCYASIAVASGETLYVVGAILGHRSAATTQRYAHLSLGPVWDAASRTAGRLAQILDSSTASPPAHRATGLPAMEPPRDPARAQGFSEATL